MLDEGGAVVSAMGLTAKEAGPRSQDHRVRSYSSRGNPLPHGELDNPQRTGIGGVRPVQRLTAPAGEWTMEWMSRCARTVLLVLLALGATALPLQSQKPKQPRPAPEEPSPYQPPAAWKSVEIGNFYLRKKDYPGALSRYQEAVKTDPHYPGGYLGMGKVYDKLGFKEKALDAYRKYLDLLPSAKDALEAKDVQKAVARLEKALASARKSSQKTRPNQ